MLKKFFVTLFIILTSSLTLSSILPTSTTFAADDLETHASEISGSNCRYFLGMPAWDCGTNLTSGNQITEDDLKNDIPKVIKNISIDIITIIGYVALGFVIYGGYLYVFSNGEPGKTAAATKTLTRAFIGLAIVGSAEIILNSIGLALDVASFNNADCFTSDCSGLADSSNADALMNTIGWVIGMTGVISAIFVVYGGIMYITSSGDATKIQKAKKTILFSLIGLIVVALAEVVTNFVIKDIVIKATESATDISDVIVGILEAIILAGGIVSVVYILIGGTNYITSLGDPGKIKKAKDTILYACIGLIVCALAFAIVNWTIGVSGAEESSYLEPSNSLSVS